MKKLMKGNEAIAEAAVRAGCRFFFGYPITPQNEIPEYMSRRLPEVGGCFLQAESEVSAINMVYGAGGAGARVMTSSSSPGISLKQEGISYLVGAEVPCVIVNIMRCGPGLGGIQPAQSDYYQATRGGGHGDYRTCVLAPASVQEAVDLTQAAFDIADRYRNPVMVLGDGMIGQMMEPVDMDNNYHPAVDLAEKIWAANGHEPGPGLPRNIINSLYIDPKVLERHCERLESKYKKITEKECRWQEEMLADAELVVVAYGTTSRVVRSAIRQCREQGYKVGMLRPITLWPFPAEAIRKTIPTAKHFLTVEMSAGQMVDDVRLAVNGERPVHFYGRMGGVVPSVAEVVAEIKKYAPPHPRNDGGLELDAAIDEKLEAVTGAVKHILEKARKTIYGAKMSGVQVLFQQETDAKPKEAGTMFDEHSFDEIETKFKAALNQMKHKLKEATDTITETSTEEMEQKVKDAADKMAEKIKEAALKMEQKIKDVGFGEEPETPVEPAASEPEIAAQEAASVYATASVTMKQEQKQAADELEQAVEAAMAPAEPEAELPEEAPVEAPPEPAPVPEAPTVSTAPEPDDWDDDDDDDDDWDDWDDDDDDTVTSVSHPMMPEEPVEPAAQAPQEPVAQVPEEPAFEEPVETTYETPAEPIAETPAAPVAEPVMEFSYTPAAQPADEMTEEPAAAEEEPTAAEAETPAAEIEEEPDTETWNTYTFEVTEESAVDVADAPAPEPSAEIFEEPAVEAPAEPTPEEEHMEEPASAPIEEPATEIPETYAADTPEEPAAEPEKAKGEVDELLEKLKHKAKQLDEKLENASDALDDISADDVEEKLKNAAQAVEDKLSEAGKKIEAFFSDPGVKEKSKDAAEHASSFFDRAGKSFASGLGSFMKNITRNTDKTNPNDKKPAPEEPQDKGDE